MFQTDQVTAATSLPTPGAPLTQGWFTNGNPAGGVPATILDADFMNMLMMELINIVEAAGLVPSKTTYNQVLTAIRALSLSKVVLADTGAANAYTAVNAVPLTVTTWVDGVTQQIRIAHANTGASTYAPDGLSVIPIYGLELQPLQGGELLAGSIASLKRETITGVNGGNPICVLTECAGGALQIPPSTQSGHAVNQSQVVGVGQSLVNETSSRAIGTTYTNTTGKAIVVYVQCSSASSGNSVGLFINGSIEAANVIATASSQALSMNALIPAGATYSVASTAGSATLSNWYELR
jgi:hypothetical protein